VGTQSNNKVGSDFDLSPRDAGVVIVNWNARPFLKDCLQSLLREGLMASNIVVVDHGSTDGSVDLLRQEYPELRLVVDTKNSSYARAINSGTAHLSTPILIISNPDIIVHGGAISEMLGVLREYHRVGLVGCKVVDQQGNDTTRFSRTGFIRGVLLPVIPGSYRGYWRKTEQKVHKSNVPFEVCFVEGAFMMIRREAFDWLGGFDEGFSFFSEDADFAVRLRKAGWKVFHTPMATITHFGGGSFAHVPVRRTVEFYESMLLFYKRHSYRHFLWLRRFLLLIVKAKLGAFKFARKGESSSIGQQIETHQLLLSTLRRHRGSKNGKTGEEIRPQGSQRTAWNPLVSIIVPTYNRVDCLIQLLEALKSQTYQNFEVLIIDQSDTLEEKKEKYFTHSGTRLKLIRTKSRGRPAAKNIGIREARGDLLLFCDDDILPPEDLIEIHVRAYDDLRIGAVSCRTVDNGRPRICPRRILQITPYGKMIAGFDSDLTSFVRTLVGANMSVRKDVQKEIGLFDTSFGGTAIFEEPDFSIRLIRSGYKILFTNKTTVGHFSQSLGNDDLRKSNAADYYHWFHHNEMIYFLKNYSRLNLLLVILFCLLRTLKQAIINRLSIRETIYVFSGIFRGIDTYRRSLP
jgi:GT2 family glycosyltransferase